MYISTHTHTHRWRRQGEKRRRQRERASRRFGSNMSRSKQTRRKWSVYRVCVRVRARVCFMPCASAALRAGTRAHFDACMCGRLPTSSARARCTSRPCGISRRRHQRTSTHTHNRSRSQSRSQSRSPSLARALSISRACADTCYHMRLMHRHLQHAADRGGAALGRHQRGNRADVRPFQAALLPRYPSFPAFSVPVFCLFRADAPVSVDAQD